MDAKKLILSQLKDQLKAIKNLISVKKANMHNLKKLNKSYPSLYYLAAIELLHHSIEENKKRKLQIEYAIKWTKGV